TELQGALTSGSGADGSLSVETELQVDLTFGSGVDGFLNILRGLKSLYGDLTGTSGIDGSLDGQPELGSSIAEISGAEGALDGQPGLESSIIEISGTSTDLSNESYLLCERSVEDGEPEELYLFSKIGSVDYWSYTSGDSDISYSDKDYNAVLISRGDIKLDSNSLKTQLEIKTSLSNPFVRNFISESIEGTISLTIYRRHFDFYVTYWKGYVRGIIFKPNSKIAIISAGLKTSSLKRYGLMRKYQRNCGLALYSTWC
ncbi:unnamed protein product, partial [marine sediment metagenome]